jgi:hypothetical protein
MWPSNVVAKWLVVIAGVVVVVVGGVAGSRTEYGREWLRWYTYDRHVDNVLITIGINIFFCSADKGYPLTVVVKNNSGRTVEQVSFWFKATYPGRSTNLVSWQSGGASDDHILSPGQEEAFCYSVPQFIENVADPLRGLEWSITRKSVKFTDGG